MKKKKEKEITTNKESSEDANVKEFKLLQIEKDAPPEVLEASDVVSRLDDEEKQAVAKVVEHQLIESFSGPLPPPNILEGYKRVDKGLPDRIMSMAEREQESITAFRKRALELQGRDTFLGMVFAFMTILITLIGGIILLLNDKDAAGYIAIISGVVGIAGLFLNSKKEDKKSKEKE